MTLIAVLSPHTDDAIFSVGEYMAGLKGERDRFCIITPYAGLPSDSAGFNKHTTLRREHEDACDAIGASFENGDFLDDVYPPCNPYEFAYWLLESIRGYDEVWIPLGIFHPDHVQVNAAAVAAMPYVLGFPLFRFYEDLPYREDYPGLGHLRLKQTIERFGELTLLPKPLGFRANKREAVLAYVSQTTTKGLLCEGLMDRILQQERVWCIP